MRLRGVVVGLLLGAAGLLVGFSGPAIGDADPFNPPLGSRELEAVRQAPAPPTDVHSRAAVVLDGATGHSLMGRNADLRLPPASLTKLMTALVAIERAGLSDPIMATARSRSEPSTIGLDPGDVLSLEDMLYGLLLNSGNDAALAIAETVGAGSIERFVGWMNERALRMGLRNTHYANPHGLDEDGHYSSARDQAEVARAAVADPRLARILLTPRYEVRGPPLYVFRNTNPLIGAYPGLEGGKTGFTDGAGRCLVAVAARDGRRVVAVVLNSPDIARETRILLDAGFATGRVATLTTRPGFARVESGAGANPGPSVVLAGWESALLRAFIQDGAGSITFLGRRWTGW